MEVQTAVRQKASALPSGKLVEIYIQLRDRRAVRKTAFDAEDAADKGKQEKLEGVLLERFKAEKIDSVKTPFGTAFTELRATASVASKDDFYAFCVGEDELDLIDMRANKANVQTYREAHEDLPPGINWTETKVVKVRRS